MVKNSEKFKMKKGLNTVDVALYDAGEMKWQSTGLSCYKKRGQ